MWLLHFIFEGLFVYFFQNYRKRCYIRQKEIMMMVRKSEDKSKPSWKKPEKVKGESYSTDLNMRTFQMGVGFIKTNCIFLLLFFFYT